MKKFKEKAYVISVCKSCPGRGIFFDTPEKELAKWGQCFQYMAKLDDILLVLLIVIIIMLIILFSLPYITNTTCW